MAKLDASSTFKRLQNRYRLVVMNDDTYEEVVTFKLSRKSVYIFLSTIFLLLVGLTAAIIVFTPLRYYIPGYGSVNERKELMQLKIKTDSLDREMKYRELYLEGLKKALTGDGNVVLDTTTLAIPQLETINE